MGLSNAEEHHIWKHLLAYYLCFLGCWLLLYRTLIWMRRCRNYIKVCTLIVCSASWVLLGPLLPWPSAWVQWLPYLIMGFLGIALGTFAPGSYVVAVGVTLGASLGAIIWQLALCTSTPVSFTHALTLLVAIVVVVCPTTFTHCGVFFWECATIPALGALLLTVGAAELRPDLKLGITAHNLFVEPCIEPSFQEHASFRRNFLALGAVWLAGMVIQQLLRAIPGALDDSTVVPQSGSVVESLLDPDDRVTDRNTDVQSIVPGAPDTKGGNERHPMIVEAITDLSFDMSRLDPMEQRTVQICRDDEDSANRIMFGGGLV